METIFVSLISLALIIISSVTMVFNTLQSTNKTADSWKQMEMQTGIISRTDISALPSSNYTGGSLDITVRNDGQTNLTIFPKWDVIVQYDSGEVRYVTYSDSYPPQDNQWTVKGIYSTGETPEIFDPNVLDPGEQMVLTIVLNPSLGSGETCRITISTPNGVKSQTQVTRE
jgi:hypothetical protein